MASWYLAPSEVVLDLAGHACKALSNAVRWHCEDRVILRGNRTAVLR